ncbi:hypothetical protein [Neobacillus drentensis]|uniref:hypothetical protein n=1 Tax=Neobacillus drentensis TaxID=220684 RepID=UPI002863E690|nr:hypothetical protein [Neobacillus drentensis]MDR7237117.1 putative RecB family endonuclease [Neobacillus drentensis]
MFNKFKLKMLNENQMYLHEKKVDIPKLTPERWKKLFEKVDLLPGIIVQVLLAPKKDFYSTILTAVDMMIDEVVEVVAILTEIDAEYIKKNVGIDELIEFITKTVKKNQLTGMVKNLQSLLPKPNLEEQKADESQ